MFTFCLGSKYATKDTYKEKSFADFELGENLRTRDAVLQQVCVSQSITIFNSLLKMNERQYDHENMFIQPIRYGKYKLSIFQGSTKGTVALMAGLCARV